MASRVLELDAHSLKALAHPLRTQIMRVLRLRDRVSVTSLAAELGETTGATSYHLRQLARHGFVTEVEPPEDPSPGRGRKQTWWGPAVDQIHISGYEMLADPDTREALTFLNRDFEADRSRRLTNWLASATQWSETWQRASSDGDDVLRLSPTQTRALADELKAVIAKYTNARPGGGARPVDVQFAVFPTDDGTRA